MLRRAGRAAARDERAVAVEHDHVPERADVVAVPGCGRRAAGLCAEVGEVVVEVAGDPVVVAGRRARAGLRRPAPRRLVADAVLVDGAVLGVVAEREDAALDALDHLAREIVVAVARAVRLDVAGADDDRIGAGGRVEGADRAGRGRRAVVDGGVPLVAHALLAGRPDGRLRRAGGDARVGRDLLEDAAPGHAPEEAHASAIRCPVSVPVAERVTEVLVPAAVSAGATSATGRRLVRAAAAAAHRSAGGPRRAGRERARPGRRRRWSRQSCRSPR